MWTSPSPPPTFWTALQAESSVLQYPIMTGKPHGGLQYWLKIQVQWSKQRSMSTFGFLPIKYCSLEKRHDGVLWVEVCSQAALTLLTYLIQDLQTLFRYWCIIINVCVCVCFVDELKDKLQDFVSGTNSQRPGFIKMVRHSKQEGLIRSRVSGWRAATAPVVALFDAHVEFNIGWWVTHNECGMRLAQLNTRALVI